MSDFDYIVVGAGSAGAVVAARLSEDPTSRVLLVEAGGSHKTMNVKIPAAFNKLFKTDRDWEYYTEPEPHLNDRRLYHPRAKMLGGCSSMNAMIYMRGSRHDYDAWAADGATGWSYDEVLPYFKRSENNSRGADEFHGVGGPLHIQDQAAPNPFSQRIVDGMLASGFDRNDDFNGPEQLGAGIAQVTQKNGRRWTTADGYLVPAKKRRNLTVLTNTHVLRLRVSNGSVTGVELERNGAVEFHRADREVVISAGAFNTPQLLMLSGIGPADHLNEHGIDTIVDNPNVGANLMDHPFYLANFETTAKGTLAEAESPIQLLKFLGGKGLLTSNVAEACAFMRTRDDEAAPDMQIFGAPAFFNNHGFTTHDRPAYTLALSLVGPKSRGQVRLRSADPKQNAAVTFNYFADRRDMESMVTGLERARDIVASGPLRGQTTSELFPGAAAKTRTDLEASVRANVEHTYHPACTARIGDELTGVVDAQLRVHGIAGLRVADTSVFPTITHGNTHAPAVMVGEKAADLIRTQR